MKQENWCRIHKQEHNNCVYFTQKRPNVNTIYVFRVMCDECNETLFYSDKEIDTSITTICRPCYKKLLNQERC